MMRIKVYDRVEIIETGQRGTVIHRNGNIVHVQTPKGELIKTETKLVRVLGLMAEILASIITIISFFKKF